MPGNPQPVPWERVQQALRPLKRDELALLEQSIVEDGVLEAIKVLPDGRIVDGHHRHALARQLNVSAAVHVFDVDEHRGFRIAMKLNAARRQLSLAERKAAVEQTLVVEPERSNRAIADEHRVDEKTVRTARKRVAATRPISETGKAALHSGKRGRHRPRATVDDRARARAMAGEGMSQSEIATRLGFTQGAISRWLRRESPTDELAKQREQHRLRNQRAWQRMLGLNDSARRVWADDRGAILRAIDEHPEHNLVVALAMSTRRTRDIAQCVLDAIDPKLNQAERERMDAFARDSGFSA